MKSWLNKSRENSRGELFIICGGIGMRNATYRLRKHNN